MKVMRPAAVLTAVLLGGIAAPAADAAAPERIQNTVDELSCVFETQQGAVVFFFASADRSGSGSGMFVEGSNGDLLLNGVGGTASFGPAFAAAVGLIAFPSGDPAGTAVVEAILTPAGEPQVEQVRERNGNSWTRGTVSTADYVIDPTSVTVPGYTVVPQADDCTGSRIVFDVFTTNPQAGVYSDTTLGSAICDLAGLADGQVRLSGTARLPFFEVVIDDGTDPQKASGELNLHGQQGVTTAPLIALTTGEPVADLTIRVSLQRIGTRQHEQVHDDGILQRVSFVPYTATITVTTSDGRSGTTQCYAEAVTEKIIIGPQADA
jgi:hypothetical protein